MPASNNGKWIAAVMVLGLALDAAAQGTTAQPATPSTAEKQTAKPATASAAMAPNTGKSVSVASVDKKFVMTAAQAGMAEVQMSQLAAQKAADPQVKQFAE